MAPIIGDAGKFAKRVATYVGERNVRLEDDLIPPSAVAEILAEFSDQIFDEMVKAECAFCRQGYTPNFMAKAKKFAHRQPQGTGGRMIWVPCRASALWILVREGGSYE